MSMTLESSAFKHGQPIPRKYSGEGEDLSPALIWSGVPNGTVELALLCDDPDAPMPEPWVHWIIYGIAPTVSGLPEGIARAANPPAPAGACHGANSWPRDNLGYRGPMPPPGHGPHRYFFKLYALDAPLGLAAGADKKALLAAIEGHVLAEAELIGTYER